MLKKMTVPLAICSPVLTKTRETVLCRGREAIG
jgi:hypothetical protein